MTAVVARARTFDDNSSFKTFHPPFDITLPSVPHAIWWKTREAAIQKRL